MLYRKKYNEILDWYKNAHYALLVTGARQVGKTYLIESVFTTNNIPYHKINLIEFPNIKNELNAALQKSPSDFLFALSNFFNKPLKDGDVIFIDEVQECKEIVTIIKFLVEQTPYKFVLSGSLLGVELNNLRSAPVGYLGYIELFPLDFEEFLIANNIDTQVITTLQNCFIDRQPINPMLHHKILELFYKYLVVGGMPQVVQSYVDSKDLKTIYKIQDFIKFTYKKDFTKYETTNKKLHLINVYDLIPSELNNKSKRYNFTSVGVSNHYARYAESFNWLIDAGVCIPVFNSTEAKIPLEINKKHNLFKLFSNDVGLLTQSFGQIAISKILTNGQDINCGAIYENVVAQELKAHGYKLYYYSNKKHGEVDFIIEFNNNVCPIEVKSGKDYKFHPALNFVVQLNNLSSSFIFSNSNISQDDACKYYPIYMIMFINKDVELIMSQHHTN